MPIITNHFIWLIRILRSSLSLPGVVVGHVVPLAQVRVEASVSWKIVRMTVAQVPLTHYMSVVTCLLKILGQYLDTGVQTVRLKPLYCSPLKTNPPGIVT